MCLMFVNMCSFCPGWMCLMFVNMCSFSPGWMCLMFVNMCASWLCCSYSRTLSTQNLLQILWGVLKCETRLYNLGDLGRRMCRDKKKVPLRWCDWTDYGKVWRNGAWKRGLDLGVLSLCCVEWSEHWVWTSQPWRLYQGDICCVIWHD